MATASSFQIYERIFTELSAALSSYVNEVAASVIGAITPVATSLFLIYVMLWGWAMMRGAISEPVTDGISRIVRLALIGGIALNLGRYNAYLSDLLWQSPDAFASHVASGYSDEGSNAQYLDKLLGKIFDFGNAYWEKAMAPTIPNLGLLAVAIAIYAVGIFATGYAAFLLALAKMALAILLGIGPLFVLFIIFEPTKRLFDAWIGQALNYGFLIVLTAATIKLMLTIIAKYLGDVTVMVSEDAYVNQAVPAILLCLIAGLMLMQLPSISSALGGGVAVSTLGAVRWGYDKVSGGIAAMRPSNMRRSYYRMASDVRIVGSLYRRVTGRRTNQVAKG